ncbi:uncharacterized protein LOC129003623 [Macrosteles quadrilineatus]|uniref:uncharacterized protein LOC129003623 n=1 Tax=Macrosteles quadrilineatus TaxID=74068 RepID=UPI0023E2F02B|nr:uncharacterized protein LOC129003623 [Macrosteles quadrilineatus]
MSSNCGICGVSIENSESEQKIKCTGVCGNFFHSRCAQDDLVGAKTRSLRDWKCKKCRPSLSATSEVSADGTKELLQALEDFKQKVFMELKSTRNDISELKESLNFVSNMMDDSNKLMTEIKGELATLKKENDDLRKENATLTVEVTSLKDRVRSLEQYSRKNNVEISGIPQTPNEDVVKLVKDVGAALGIDIQEGDISIAHRVPSFKKERTQPLIVQFSRRTSRETLLKSFREKKTMTAKEIHAAFPARSVYVNEHLSPENKQFLSKLKEKCKEVGYKYAWCREGKFFVRKCVNDRCLRVDTYEELEKLK